MPTPVDVPSQPTKRGRRDAPARRYYEAMAKHARSVSSCSSTRLVKSPRHSVTIELAKELSSPRHVSEIAGTTMDTPVPILTTHEVASDVTAPLAVLLWTISETVPATSKPDIVIVAGLGFGAILSPPVMIPGIATPPRNLITGLVSSRKSNP